MLGMRDTLEGKMGSGFTKGEDYQNGADFRQNSAVTTEPDEAPGLQCVVCAMPLYIIITILCTYP